MICTRPIAIGCCRRHNRRHGAHPWHQEREQDQFEPLVTVSPAGQRDQARRRFHAQKRAGHEKVMENDKGHKRHRSNTHGIRARTCNYSYFGASLSHSHSHSHSHFLILILRRSVRSRGRGARATGQSVSQLPFTVPPRAQHLLSGVEGVGEGSKMRRTIFILDISVPRSNRDIRQSGVGRVGVAGSGNTLSSPSLPVLAVARCHPHNSSAIQCIQVHSRPHVRTHGRHNSSHDDALESRVRPSTQHASTHTSHSPQHATATSACRDDKVAEAGRAHAKLSSSCGLFLKRYSAM